MWRRSFVLLKVSDPYQVLGVPQNATAAQIKAVYRTLSKKYHPDVTGGDGEAFKKINAAYAAVRDGRGPPQARAQPKFYRPQQASSATYQARDFSFTRRRGPYSASPFPFARRYYSGHHRQQAGYSPPKDVSLAAVEHFALALCFVWLATVFFTSMVPHATDAAKREYKKIFSPEYYLTQLFMRQPTTKPNQPADFAPRQEVSGTCTKNVHVVKA